MHANYLNEFSNPSKYSFINYTYNLIDRLNFRYDRLSKDNDYLELPIYKIEFFESICVFYKDKKRSKISKRINNRGETFDVEDMRHHDKNISILKKQFNFLKYIPFLKVLVKFLISRKTILENFKMKKYFK